MVRLLTQAVSVKLVDLAFWQYQFARICAILFIVAPFSIPKYLLWLYNQGFVAAALTGRDVCQEVGAEAAGQITN
jgi:hypothetical protein